MPLEGWSTPMRQKTFTTFAIAKMLDVYPSTVANWVDSGKLKAFSTPGGHRRIMPEDLESFLIKHKMPIPPGLNTRAKEILVVDDDPIIIEAIVTFLTQSGKGFKIHTAADGFAAGKELGLHKPDLVILDIKLPGIDGFGVCRQIKALDKGVKVIAITGYDTEENRSRIMQAGADAYLAKPFRMASLMAEIEKMLG
jgi:excisionase family DNA binding protein